MDFDKTFSLEQGLRKGNSIGFALVSAMEDSDAWRNHAKGVVFLVSGAEKADILKKVLEGRDADAHYPAARVKPASGNLLWLVDEAAASKLGPSLITSVQRSSKHTQ